MAFIDQGEFGATKTLSGRRAPCCDKYQFHAKMTVSTQTVFKISLLNIMVLINPLATDDECPQHATLAACYQLAQSVLKICFALAKKVGWGRGAGFSTGCRAHGTCLGWL